MRNVLIYLLLTLVIPLQALSQIPETGFHPGWEVAGKMRILTAASLFNQINGGAELFLEFGFDTLWVQRYENSGRELGLEIYRMKDSGAALGVYLLKCGNETPLPGIPARNSYDRFQTTLLKGQYFIQVSNYDGDESLNTALKALLAAYLPGISEASSVHLLHRLPQENQVKGTFRLIRGPFALEPIYTFGPGDIFRLEGKRYAFLADYEESNGYTRMIIEYPDEATAQEVMASLSTDLDPYLEKLTEKPGIVTFKDWMDEYGIITHHKKTIDIRFHLDALPEGRPSID